MDHDTVNFFDCTLCKIKSIFEKSLFKHHIKWHPTIPYQKDLYKLVQTRRKGFQCNVCREIINRSERENHRLRQHPMFKHHRFLYKAVWMMEDLATMLWKKWPNSVCSNETVKCPLCQNRVQHNRFIQHFRSTHPQHLTSAVAKKEQACRERKRQKKEDTEIIPLEDIKKEKDDTINDGCANDERPAEPHTAFDILNIGFIKEEPQSELMPVEAANELRLLIKEEKDEPMDNRKHLDCSEVLSCPGKKSNRKEKRRQKEKNDIGSTKTEEETGTIPIEEANGPSLLTKEKKDESMNSASESNTDQMLPQGQGISFFHCILCKNKRLIADVNLLKHQTEEHPNDPFQSNVYILEKTVKKEYQCNICSSIVKELNREKHRQRNHPNFVFIRDLFEPLHVTYKPTSGEEKWPPTKDAKTALCKHCRINICRSHFLRHFELFHPEKLHCSYAQSNINQKENIGTKGVEVDAVKGNQAPDEKQAFFTISVSNSELQRLLQQNRIYGHNRELILKDSA